MHMSGIVLPEYVTAIEKFVVPDTMFLKDIGLKEYYEVQLWV